MKGVQCYELFGVIALKNHTFSFFFMHILFCMVIISFCKPLCVDILCVDYKVEIYLVENI